LGLTYLRSLGYFFGMYKKSAVLAVVVSLTLASCAGNSSSSDSAAELTEGPDSLTETTSEALPPCEAPTNESEISAANYRHRYCPVGGEDLPKEFLEDGLWLANKGMNIPKRDPEFHNFFGDNVTPEWRGDALKMMDILIDNFGGYDRWVLASYDPDDSFQNRELVDGLDGLGFFKYNFDSGVSPDFSLVNERASCLSGFSGGPDRVRDFYSFCNNRLLTSNPDEMDFYGVPAIQYRMLSGLIHEYHHHVQRAHMLGKEGGGGNGPGDPIPPDGFVPAWWMEGTAQLSPGWILRDHFDEFDVTKKSGLGYDEIVASKEDWPSQIFKTKNAIAGSCCGWFKTEFVAYVERIQSGGTCTEVDANQEWYPGQGGENTEECDIAHWHLMARYLMHITSPDIAMVSILEDAWRLGWHGSFKKHVGMTMDDFYDEYEDFMKNYDLSAGVPDWIYPPETPFKDTVNFWSIKSGPQD
jgi:hypothetical protein